MFNKQFDNDALTLGKNRCVSRIKDDESYMRYASVNCWRDRSDRYTLRKKAYIEFLGVYDSYTVPHMST
jgi:hypothetical protein